MTMLFLLIVFVFGTIIGSFLNVVILRTHTKRSLGGNSHCMSCGERLRALDLVPIVSYLVLLARCRHCGARISSRYALIEAATGCLFVGVVSLGLPVVSTAMLLIFMVCLLVVFVYDLDHLIIPDEYVIALTIVAVFLVGITGLPQGETWLQRFLAPALTFAFLGGLWKVSKGRWIGLGDAKLSVPLALTVGLTHAFSFVVFSFWIGACVSVVLLVAQHALRRGQKYLRFSGVPLTMKTEVPFAPFLIASFVLVYFFHFDVYILTDTGLTYFTVR
jgi:prepilin signal peptidase PulO-like enzyme (type II secretory pathway)